MPIAWTRPSLLVNTPARVWIAGGIAGAVATLAVLQLALPAKVVPVAITASPVEVTMTPAAKQVVVVPQVMMVSAPAPVVDDVIVSTKTPRALAPTVNAACVLPAIGEDGSWNTDAACHWDHGFPAVSPDGKLVAIEYIPDDGGRGYPGLTIRFMDVATSKIVRDVLVLDPDEFSEERPEAMNARVIKRAAAAQRSLAGYRTMTLVPIVDPLRHWEDTGEVEETRPEELTVLHAERAGESMRLVDPARGATGTVLWQGRASIPKPKTDEEQECSGWSRFDESVAWDAATGTVLVSMDYRTGGCLCPDLEFQMVQRVPAVAPSAGDDRR